MHKAIAAFQQENGLRGSGRFDLETWRKLVGLSPEPALQEYSLTDEDVKGPFVEKIPDKLEEQADLDRLSYTGTTELLAEKFHMSEALLKALNRGKKFDEVGTVIAVANVSGIPAKGKVRAARIEVNKRDHTVRVLDKGGKLIAFYPASIGSSEKPAPSGTSKVTNIVTKPDYTYNPD